MKLADSRTINADVATVWNALLDPEVLKACVPGCTEMAGSASEGFEATVVQKVGPVKATFKGAVQMSAMIEQQSLTMSGEGKGGAAGFAKGGADVRLEADGENTVLHYEVEAKVGGKLAQLGSRIIDGFAKRMADQFFVKFSEAVGRAEEDAPEAQIAQDEETHGKEENAAEEQPKKGWLKRVFG